VILNALAKDYSDRAYNYRIYAVGINPSSARSARASRSNTTIIEERQKRINREGSAAN
jgi:hypothetical protein